MSLPRNKPALQSAHANAAQWLSQNIVRFATEITNTHFLAHPELDKRYGQSGRQKCTEDTAYHLHYLAEAIAANSTTLFINHTGWAKIMLCSRGIDSQELEHSLDVMRRVL